MSDEKTYRLQRLAHPKNWNGFERTYHEIVKVTDGVAVCRTKFAVTLLTQTRDYQLIEDEGATENEQPEPSSNLDENENPDEAGNDTHSEEPSPDPEPKKEDEAKPQPKPKANKPKSKPKSKPKGKSKAASRRTK